jgi:hypothetical protein
VCVPRLEPRYTAEEISASTGDRTQVIQTLAARSTGIPSPPDVDVLHKFLNSLKVQNYAYAVSEAVCAYIKHKVNIISLYTNNMTRYVYPGRLNPALQANLVL